MTINVPFVTQNGNGVYNDCGPADCLAIARWVGKGLTTTIAAVATAIGKLGKLTGPSDLVAAFRWFGLTPVLGAAAQYPYIQLVSYPTLPYKAPGYESYTGDHWIIRTGPSTYNDPLFADSKGANLPTSETKLNSIDKGVAYHVGIAETPTSYATAFLATCKAISWNVRATPELAGAIIGVVKNNDVIKVEERIRAGAYEFGKVRLVAAGANLWTAANESLGLYAYTRLDGYTYTLPTEPPKVGPPVKLGYNSVSTMRDVETAFARGCRFAIILNDFLFATQLKDRYPDAVVMARRVELPRGIPTVDDAIRALEGAADPDIVYTYFNENDQIGASPAEIRARAEFEGKLAAEIKRRSGASFVAGGYSMGTPDYTNPDVYKALREAAAPRYNDGTFGWHVHNYSPKPGHIFSANDELIWYENSYRRLFAECGFNPALRKVYFSETGLDEGGVGGYSGHQMSVEAVVNELRRWREIHSQSIIVNGVTYPTPVVGGGLFCLGDFGKWGGYNMLSYMAALDPLYG